MKLVAFGEDGGGLEAKTYHLWWPYFDIKGEVRGWRNEKGGVRVVLRVLGKWVGLGRVYIFNCLKVINKYESKG